MLEVKKISDYVYDAILKNIVELKYAPGEKISETMRCFQKNWELAEHLLKPLFQSWRQKS